MSPSAGEYDYIVDGVFTHPRPGAVKAMLTANAISSIIFLVFPLLGKAFAVHDFAIVEDVPNVPRIRDIVCRVSLDH